MNEPRRGKPIFESKQVSIHLNHQKIVEIKSIVGKLRSFRKIVSIELEDCALVLVIPRPSEVYALQELYRRLNSTHSNIVAELIQILKLNLFEREQVCIHLMPCSKGSPEQSALFFV